MNEFGNDAPQPSTTERDSARDGAVLVKLDATLADLEVSGMGRQSAVRAVIDKLKSGDVEHILVQESMRDTGYNSETVVALLLAELSKYVKVNE